MKLLSERLAYIFSSRPELEGERGQTGLVKASGASKSVVNQWLNGAIKSMDISYALNIERELGFSHIWLMTGSGEPLASEREIRAARAPTGEIDWDNPVLAALRTDELLRLLTAYQISDDIGRNAFHAVADTVLQRVGMGNRNKTR